MARIRSIKPEFCSSADTGALSRDARLFFLQLFLEADDAGRMLWIPRKLCGVLYPHDEGENEVTGSMIVAWATECARRGMLAVYQIAGVQYVQILNWAKHQKISNPTPSRLPPPENADLFILSGASPEPLRNLSGESPEALRSDLGPRKGIKEEDQELSPTAQGTPGASSPAGQLTLVAVDGKKVSKQSADEVVDLVLRLYHELLPACRKVAVKNPKLRKKILDADRLASATIREQGLKIDRAFFWEAFFGECQDDPWLRGELPNPNNSAWKQNLDVLLKEERFAEIVNRALARPRDDSDEAAA